MKTLLPLILGLAPSYGYSVQLNEGLQSTRALLTLFQEFQSKSGHHYDPAEAPMRIKIFRKSLKKIVELNSRQTTWEAGLTLFADMTVAEQAQYRGLNASFYSPAGVEGPALLSPGASSLDWRSRGHVTPVKSQKGNSCWTFSTVTCIEGLYRSLTGRLVEFADQELMDCVYPTDDDWRDGRGMYTDAFDWIKKSGRLGLRSEAPHTGRDGPCNYDGKTNALAGYEVTGYRDTAQNEAGLISGLSQGPVAVALQTYGSNLGFYDNGIYRYSSCPGTGIDHGVTAVGYTRDAIIIKNSYGTNWGVNGYLYWARGMSGHNCMLYDYGAFPILVEEREVEVEE